MAWKYPDILFECYADDHLPLSQRSGGAGVMARTRSTFPGV